ncbi:MAG: HAD-IA family hydrolase [Terriglobales bacterium]
MLNFAQYRLLSFDCYGTLIDWETGIFSALRPILAAHGVAVSDSEVLRLYSELEFDAEQGEYRSYREVLQSVVRGFGQRLGFIPTEAEIRSLSESLPAWLPFPDTIAALGTLKERYQLAVVSNVDDDLFASTAGRLQVPLDFVITAQQARAYKPSLQMFKLAQQCTGVEPGQWLHIGQSVYHDVVPANFLGIDTVWVNRASPRPGSGAAKTATAQPGLEVPDLRTLAQLATGNGKLQTGSPLPSRY